MNACQQRLFFHDRIEPLVFKSLQRSRRYGVNKAVLFKTKTQRTTDQAKGKFITWQKLLNINNYCNSDVQYIFFQVRIFNLAAPFPFKIHTCTPHKHTHAYRLIHAHRQTFRFLD